jgi:hypothetical protein
MSNTIFASQLGRRCRGIVLKSGGKKKKALQSDFTGSGFPQMFPGYLELGVQIGP